MRGYLILELDLPDEVDSAVFPTVLREAKEALGAATIQRVTYVHAAIGEGGLRESVAYMEARQ